MRTLQFYVTRELLKTFALAVVGLTLVLSLCGAMSTLLRVDVPTAGTVLRILWLIQPMVLAITLPVSALFACAIVYGRLAADNEFDACRASGVNIHRLLAPAFALALLTALFAFVSSNYVIPKAAAGIANRIQLDISKFAYQALKSKGHFKREDKKKSELQVLYAGKVDLANREGQDVLLLRDAAFLELERDELVRCGTVGQGLAEFKTADESLLPLVEVSLEDVRAVDIAQGGGRLIQNKRQSFGSRELPSTLFYDPKWLPLGDLLNYKRNPTRLPPIRPQLLVLRRSVRDQTFYRRVCDRFKTPGKPLVLADGQRRYEINAESAGLIEEDLSPELKKVKVTYTWADEKGQQRKRLYEAGAGILKIQHKYSGTRDVLLITLRNGVRFKDSLDPNKWVPHESIDLEAVAAPAESLTGDEVYSDEQLLGLDVLAGSRIRNRQDLINKLTPLGLGPQIEKNRMKAVADTIRLQHEIVGTLHSRLSLCASALVTIVLAAALGIIFRNGQFLTAFAISFLPALLIVAMNMLGRKQSESPDPYLHLAGVGVIWAGIVLLALVDLVVLKRYLKR
jgi:lipopolysaccharide export LptBFGC system permease protein LptF